jgi:hypothetical protein
LREPALSQRASQRSETQPAWEFGHLFGCRERDPKLRADFSTGPESRLSTLGYAAGMATKGRAIYLVYTDLADDKYDEEFNAWYSKIHVPQLMAIPGILDAARYVAVKGGPKYLAVYELEGADVIHSDAFVNRPRTELDRQMSPRVIGKNFTTVLGDQIFPAGLENTERSMAPVLQIGRMSVPESVDAKWNAWYKGEYIPGYRSVAGVIYARRYRVLEGEVGYTTVYEFESEAVPESAAWNYQREHSSPQSGAMREVMTMAMGSPGVYRRI